MQQCRAAFLESCVSAVDILGYLLPLDTMGTSSPCAKALPLPWQRQIAKTVQLMNMFNLTDLRGRSLLCSSPIWMLRIDCFLNSFLVPIYIFWFEILYNDVSSVYFPACRLSWWQCVTQSSAKVKLHERSLCVNQIFPN